MQSLNALLQMGAFFRHPAACVMSWGWSKQHSRGQQQHVKVICPPPWGLMSDCHSQKWSERRRRWWKERIRNERRVAGVGVVNGGCTEASTLCSLTYCFCTSSFSSCPFFFLVPTLCFFFFLITLFMFGKIKIVSFGKELKGLSGIQCQHSHLLECLC